MQHFSVWGVDIDKRIRRVTVYSWCSLTIGHYNSSTDFSVLVEHAWKMCLWLQRLNELNRDRELVWDNGVVYFYVWFPQEYRIIVQQNDVWMSVDRQANKGPAINSASLKDPGGRVMDVSL